MFILGVSNVYRCFNLNNGAEFLLVNCRSAYEVVMTNAWSFFICLLRQLRHWTDGIFQDTDRWYDAFGYIYYLGRHHVQPAILVCTIVLSLQGLRQTYGRHAIELPRHATQSTQSTKRARRIKFSLPLAPLLTLHLTLKSKKREIVVKMGCSLGVVKAMIVVELGEDWKSSIKRQTKLYGSTWFMKSSATI